MKSVYYNSIEMRKSASYEVIIECNLLLTTSHDIHTSVYLQNIPVVSAGLILDANGELKAS